MKHHILVVLASLFLAAGTVQAQSLGLVADIPFDFVVGKTTLHAGKYTRNHREVEEARAAQLQQLAIMASLARAR